MWNPDTYLENLYQDNSPKYSFSAKSIEQWKEWHHQLKQTFINALGGFPVDKVDLNPQVLEEKEYQDYVQQRIVFNSYKLLQVPAYLLIPKKSTGKLPAVVACHGHGYGSRDIVGLNHDGTEKTGDPGYQKNFALELVKRGFIVIAPELLGFGDRRLLEDKENPLDQSSCHKISTYLLMMGKTIAGLRVYDIIRTIDYLVSREDVDPQRIGCMGISGGGLVCGFTSAIDERVKVAVISGYTNTFKDSVMSVFHCVDNFVPGLVRYAEMYDILGMIAPRPLLIESGTNDPIFPVGATIKSYNKIAEIYELLNAEDKLDRDIFEGIHEISGVKAYDWFEKWL